ncbi:MAG TPA: iron-sulfur cluster repair di-iron protein, partial [Algoriphagus sp.]|nr:iron-sulfur cluster repair di-iron protein [Algoriphagus sp.]
MKNIAELPISEIVSRDYRAALVFRTFGIDFCCKGDQTIQEACTQKKIDPQLLFEKLVEAFTQPAEDHFDYKSWPLTLLANYIE